MRLTLSRTACKRAARLGLDADTILDIFHSADSVVVPSEQRDGQHVISKDGYNIVGVYMDETRFHGITIFKEKKNV